MTNLNVTKVTRKFNPNYANQILTHVSEKTGIRAVRIFDQAGYLLSKTVTVNIPDAPKKQYINEQMIYSVLFEHGKPIFKTENHTYGFTPGSELLHEVYTGLNSIFRPSYAPELREKKSRWHNII